MQPNEAARATALARQLILTKPNGSLGRLEALAVQLAALQNTAAPKADRVHITVFAADHGVVAEGVSAYPQSVTREMVRNFERGGAAINVLARQLGATLRVIDVGVAGNTNGIDNFIAPGTANFLQAPAMAAQQVISALNVGRNTAMRAKDEGAHIFIGGEMGIGNTTAATALSCALLGLPPEQIVGPGTGLTSDGVAHKTRVIQHALTHHSMHIRSPLDALQRLGGFEIAALVGSYIACAQVGVPVLIDGFIATSAALVATRLNAQISDWLLYAHASAEPGHARLLAALNANPLLDLGMRLGEGSGAAVAVPLLRAACDLHNQMATFAEAGVSQKTSDA